MRQREPAAVLWDMDGTIIDTEPLWIEAERAMLQEWGLRVSDEDARDWVGIGLWDLAAIFRDRGVPLAADEIVRTLSASVDEQLAAGRVHWRRGARELLADLGRVGIPCGLVTMSIRSQAEQIARMLPRGTFRTVTGGDDVTRPKPYPDPYLIGADSLGADPRECVAIEDSPTGIRAAHSAGSVVIGVPNLLDLSHAPCDIVLNSLSQIDAAGIVDVFSRHAAG